jgi:hypothetical protein
VNERLGTRGKKKVGTVDFNISPKKPGIKSYPRQQSDSPVGGL